MKKTLFFIFTCLLSLCGSIFANTPNIPVSSKTSIVGGGIVGALESYYAYKDAQKEDKKICVMVYEKGHSLDVSSTGISSTNTSYNIVPSLTIDEILSVVPRGSELVEKLAVLFSQPGGIRVDDVSGIHEVLHPS
jgi:glycine/D-amino acid oxidase-like deaminating enzyme